MSFFRRLWLCIALAACLMALACAGFGAVDVGTRLQLFVDDYIIGSLNGASLVMHSPAPREVALKFDKPWEGPESAYVTVLKDGESYKMYYRAGGESTEEVTCVALSHDGVHWYKPDLNLFDYKGAKPNNIIWKGVGNSYWESHNFTPFVDANPNADPDERFKAVALWMHKDDQGVRRKTLITLASPDGIRWRRTADGPVITDGAFDSQNVAFWDTIRGCYVCYLRSAGGKLRGIARATSPDFRKWSPSQSLDYGSPPTEQFYTNAIAPYFRAPYIYLGFPMRFVPERKSVGEPPRRVDALSDAVMISSHDGLHFKRQFMEAFIRPGLNPNNWGSGHGNNTPVWGLLQTSPEEISIYWCENYVGGNAQVRRGTLRLDGFASVHAPYKGGEFVTRTLTFGGKELVINYSTSAVGSVRVELQDADGKPLQGYALSDCKEIYGDELERPVAWKNGSDLSALRGKPVRLRFVMKDADLYSLRFR